MEATNKPSRAGGGKPSNVTRRAAHHDRVSRIVYSITLSARTNNAGSAFKPIDSRLEVAHWSNVNGFSTGMAATP
jgi:hypothetical protein